MPRSRLSKISNIRALAIFLVVLGHSIILYSSSWDLYQTSVRSAFLDQLKRLIDVPQMPLFFSLSGFLFFFTFNKHRSFWNLLKNKGLRLLVPYLMIGICFLLPIRLLIRYPGYTELVIVDFAGNFFMSTDVGHLWFLPALFFIFLFSHGILWLASKIPGVRQISDLFLCVCAGLLYLEGYRIGFGYPPVLGAFSNLIWFALGYCLNYRAAILEKLYNYKPIKWCFLMLNITILVFYMLYGSQGVLFDLGMRALCVVNAYGAMPEESPRIVQKIDKNSFGIYLFHSPLIYIVFAFLPEASPWLVVFLNLVVFGACAYFLTELVRKTKLRFAIGE